MTINHLNLIVTDVTRNVNFFETYFNFKCEVIKGDNVIAVLKSARDFTLVLMKGEEASYPKDFHIGFMVDSEEEVEAIHKKLLDGQINITRAPGKIRNSFGFYFYFDNLFIEVGHYLN